MSDLRVLLLGVLPVALLGPLAAADDAITFEWPSGSWSEVAHLPVQDGKLAKEDGAYVAIGRARADFSKTGSPHLVKVTAKIVEPGTSGVMRAVTLRVERKNEVVFGTVMAHSEDSVKLVLGAFPKSGSLSDDMKREKILAGATLSGDLVLWFDEADETKAYLSFGGKPEPPFELPGLTGDKVTDIWIEIQGAYSQATEGPSINEVTADYPYPET